MNLVKIENNMADVTETKLRWKKSEKYRRKRRKQSRTKGDQEIKENCYRNVSHCYDGWFMEIYRLSAALAKSGPLDFPSKKCLR